MPPTSQSPRLTLTLIAAVANNRVIGQNNALPWHLPEDMKHFKETTHGAPVIMGRKTWESLPEKFRPLPGRANIVISRNPHYKAPGATLANSLDAALNTCNTATEAFVIGGEELYRQAIDQADRLILTEIALTVNGDAHFPVIAAGNWHETSRQSHLSSSGIPYAFVIYERT